MGLLTTSPPAPHPGQALPSGLPLRRGPRLARQKGNASTGWRAGRIGGGGHVTRRRRVGRGGGRGRSGRMHNRGGGSRRRGRQRRGGRRRGGCRSRRGRCRNRSRSCRGRLTLRTRSRRSARSQRHGSSQHHCRQTTIHPSRHHPDQPASASAANATAGILASSQPSDRGHGQPPELSSCFQPRTTSATWRSSSTVVEPTTMVVTPASCHSATFSRMREGGPIK
jgi:hypothetical protein